MHLSNNVRGIMIHTSILEENTENSAKQSSEDIDTVNTKLSVQHQHHDSVQVSYKQAKHAEKERKKKFPKQTAEQARLHSPAVSEKPAQKRMFGSLSSNAIPLFPLRLRNGGTTTSYHYHFVPTQ
jgi:hypothetical protein